MIETLRRFARSFWPVMRLRWIFFGTLLFVAALPGFAALGLRVYENALVRRTESEVAAQAAAIAATAALLLPGEDTASAPPDDASRYAPDETLRSASRYQEQVSEVDLRSSPVLPSRPAASKVAAAPDAAMQRLAGRIAPVIAETKQTTLAAISLLDAQGIVLSGYEKGLSLADLPEVQAALAGQSQTVLRHNDRYNQSNPLYLISRATAIRLHHARPINRSGKVVGVVLVSRSPAALFRGMWEDAGKIAFGTLSIFALLVVLTMVLARAVVTPIEKLSAAARALASGRKARLRHPTLEVREVRSLYDDFEVMAQSIDRRSRYLRDFAASLSHEFKTPLAGLRGGIELLQDHGADMTGAERELFLANMTEDADRLTRLVSRLMELAQADMDGGEVSEPADLQPILARLVDGFGGKGFHIGIAASGRVPKLAIEGAALETVLATMIENARQAGASSLAITTRVEDGQGIIDLTDDGPGVPEGDRTRIFDPFFTSRRGQGGTGLGLAIARALVNNRGGALELLESAEGAHFVLRLPLV
ncbi:ATP-binding protein [Erythrobacter sp. SDW2]|uniref:sensor histidine kinase n=1 Tax=Erythrobacter sp. SDW2 TaxID=2907154 RepID=UPI001F380387|nr:ATP-binding protein [Erythrobacter sp. SDW2]UIP06685.1 ATP-binding protein [Erythrobacter sp. SDW2]